MSNQPVDDKPWFRRYRPSPTASARLVCLPHAGGSAPFFLPVAAALSPGVDVIAVQYPGRQDRRAERPIYHYLEERVQAHVLICMLACYLTWHLRQAWAPLTFTDQDPPASADPVAPASRSAGAQARASRQHDETGRPYRSFRGLLAHLARLTRNQVRFAGTTATVPMLTEPASEQREAFQLIGVPIPLTMK